MKDTTRSSDRTLSLDMKIASSSSLHSRQISERGTDKIDSEKPQRVTEDIDHSIAESIITDVGVDSAPNEDSATDILSQRSKRDETRKGKKLYFKPLTYMQEGMIWIFPSPLKGVSTEKLVVFSFAKRSAFLVVVRH